MRWLGLIRLATCVAAAVFPHSAKALHFTLERAESGRIYVYASGDIVEGDTDRLEALLHAGKIEERWVVLDSPGGDVLEGMILGQFFDYHRFTTIVTHEDRCLSACFFAFAGGDRRWVVDGGQLGVHQFSGGEGDQALTQFVIGSLMDDLSGYGIDARALILSLMTPAAEMHVFTPEELRQFGIVKDGEQGNFDKREANSLGISLAEYRGRRAGYLADPTVKKCLSMGAERQFCLLTTLHAHGLRR